MATSTQLPFEYTRLTARQGELDLGLERTELARRGAGGGPLPITSWRMGHLLEDVAGGDEVFLQLVLARTIESLTPPIQEAQ